MGDKNDDSLEYDIEADGSSEVLDFLHYRLYLDKGDTLELESVIKYKDIDFLTEIKLTLKPTGGNKIKIVSELTNDITEEITETNCKRLTSF